jgi:uncharacterized repeat protein (TIGR03803 family)
MWRRLLAYRAGRGTLYRYDGSVSVLHQFPDGNFLPPGSTEPGQPTGGLVKGPDGFMYGITGGGGEVGDGTIFKWDGNAFTVVHSFEMPDGGSPQGDLMLASDGNIYGVTGRGGMVSQNGCLSDGCGTIFRFTPGASATLFHGFSGVTEGGGPCGGLLQASDGHLYGMVGGSVYRITLGGAFTVLHPVGEANGDLVEGFGGFIYGTLPIGGTNGCGSIVRLAPDGTLTTIHGFDGQPNGCRPLAGLIRGADGNLYGSTYDGGAGNLGTVFRVRMLPAVDVTANNNQKPFNTIQGPLQIRFAFDVPTTGQLPIADVYIVCRRRSGCSG